MLVSFRQGSNLVIETHHLRWRLIFFCYFRCCSGEFKILCIVGGEDVSEREFGF